MNPQQMAMELQVLRGEKLKLLQMLENMRAQNEKDKAIELFIGHAIAGYATQPRAAKETFWEKDDTTGTLVPREGGPRWVAEMALKTMSCIVSELEGMVSSNPEQSQPEEKEEEKKEENLLYLDPKLLDDSGSI